MTLAEFDALYWASKAPQLKALTDIPPVLGSEDPYSDRKTAGIGLAQQGLVVDVQTMIWGWDPYLIMTLRTQFGIGAVASVLNVAPIKTSLDPADYPPFTPGTGIPSQPPAASLVGPSEGIGPDGIEVFACNFSAAHSPLKNGDTYTGDTRGQFVYHAQEDQGGTISQWFTKAV